MRSVRAPRATRGPRAPHRLRLRSLLVLAIVMPGVVLLAGCTTKAEPNSVIMVGLDFSPAILHVPVGTTVTWENVDASPHTVTPMNATQWGTNGSGDAPEAWLKRGSSWQHTFEAPGTYAYYCLPHSTPDAEATWKGMVGAVVVTNGSASG